MLILMLAAAASAAPASADPDAAAPAPLPVDVHAKFGWAPDDAWAVTFERTTSHSASGGPRQETRTTARWIATVSGTPGALEVWTSGYTLDPLIGFPSYDLSGAYTAAMFAAAPSFRILPTAGLGDLLDLPTARAPAERLLDANTFLTPDTKARLRDVMPDAQVVAVVTDWWGSLVASWVEAELAQGAPVTTRIETPVPVLGGLPVGTDLTFTYEGHAPCMEEVPALCEAFGTRSTLDPAGVAAGIQTYTNALSNAQAGATLLVTALSQESSTRLVTEADDLRPRSLVIERVTRMRGTVARDPFDVEQTETRTWTFRPLPPPTSGAPAAAEPSRKPSKTPKSPKSPKP